MTALPAAPPVSLTMPPADQGVPPTPAPAFPGLPSPSSSTAVLPSAQGLGSQVDSQLRPSAALSTAQAMGVQAALSQAGLYRGPIDGVLSASTRAAIRAFQSAARLPPTGQLDPDTLNALTGQPSNAASTTTNLPTISNGTTSTAGNQVITFVPAATVPFALSNPISTSQEPPAGTLIQP
jgi:peptidoglycan hydrolase-like protein with peptidoglycan-binding domain